MAVLSFLARREVLLLAAVAALSRGDGVSFGVLTPEAIAFVLLALVLVGLALGARARGPSAGPWWWAGAVVACAATTLVYARQFHLGVEVPLALTLMVSTAAVVLGPGLSRWVAATIATASLCAMSALAWHWGAVNIDVFDSVQNASAAVLHGVNPYEATFPLALMVSPEHWITQPVHFGYLPGVALMNAPARLLGDIRIMSVVAFAVLAAFVVLLARESGERTVREPRVIALCLALPLTVPMVHFAWVDVDAVAGFAGWLALRRTHPRWGIACLAVALTVKPPILLAVVPLVLWSRAARREAVVAAAGAVLVILPFALMTGVGAFYYDVAGIFTTLGFRPDGLTLNAAWNALFGGALPVWFTLTAGAALAFFALRRRPQDMSDVLIAGAFLSTAAFLLAKWAFLNYYFIPACLLILALASRGMSLEGRATVSEWTSSSTTSSGTFATRFATSRVAR